MFYSMRLLFVVFLTKLSEINRNIVLCSRTAQDEKFQVLLNLYQMNPLKHSNVYKSYSDRMLSANKSSEVVALNLDSNESTREKQKSVKVKLRNIEKTIHVNSKKNRYIGQAKYNPGGKSAESFAIDTNVQYRLPTHFSLETNDFDVESKPKGPDFDTIFSHIESNENGNESTVTEVSSNKTEKSDFIISTTNAYTTSEDVLLVENVSKIPLLDKYLQFNEIGNFSDSDVIVF